MAFVEIELIDSVFEEFTLFLLSMAPIPFPLLDSLGADRLISKFEWTGSQPPVQLDAAPAGYNPPAGTIAVSARLKVHHVSIAELDAGSAGSANAATAWLVLSNPLSGLRIDLIGLDVDGKSQQRFTTSPWTLLSFGQIGQAVGSAGGIAASTLLHSDGIVTLRYATSADDNLSEPAANHLNELDQPWGGQGWLIHVAGEVFSSELENNLNQSLNPPPKDTVVEDAPTAQWNILVPQNVWGASGQFGIKKIDACPTAFGDADISAAVDASLWFATPNPNQPVDGQPLPTKFSLALSLQAEPSFWDTARCYAGNLGLGSVLLAIFSPLAGIVVGLGSFIGLDQYIFSSTADAIKGQSTPTGWHQTGSSTDYVSYESDPMNLPFFPNGTIKTFAINGLGLITAGSPPLIASQPHQVTFAPANRRLGTGMNYVFSCREAAWVENVTVQSVIVSDKFPANNVNLPVKVFPTSTAVPARYWSVIIPDTVIPDQIVQIVGADDVPTSSLRTLHSAGAAYIHTSAGIQRFDIDRVPSKPLPGELATTMARLNCLRFAVPDEFLQRDMLLWLVDPPEYNYGYPILRQWLLSFAAMAENTGITVQPMTGGRATGTELRVVPGATEEGGNLELVTSGRTELKMTISGQSPKGMRVFQRWLLPTQIFDLGGGEVLQLVRAGNVIAARQANRVVSFDLATARLAPLAAFEHIEAQAGTIVGLRGNQKFILGSGRLKPSPAAAAPARLATSRRGRVFAKLPPSSVNLADGRVAAVWGRNLVIAEPWEKPRRPGT